MRRLLKTNLFGKSLIDQYNSLIKFYHFCNFLFNLKSNHNIEFSKKLTVNPGHNSSLYYKESGTGSQFNR